MRARPGVWMTLQGVQVRTGGGGHATPSRPAAARPHGDAMASPRAPPRRRQGEDGAAAAGLECQGLLLAM